MQFIYGTSQYIIPIPHKDLYKVLDLIFFNFLFFTFFSDEI